MRFEVIGIDDSREPYFSPEVMRIIEGGDVFSGGKRHYEIVRNFLPVNAVWIDITVPLDGVFEQYKGYSDIVVFASGDPLFFGFANTLRSRLPDAELRVYPYFNSLQILCHRLLLAYHDMRIVSLTGRPWHEFDKVLIEGVDKIGILTDKVHSPSAISERMLKYGYDNYKMFVGELLGNEREQVREFNVTDLSGYSFESPNCIVLLKIKDKSRPFGISERDFNLLDGRDKMITKMPVRLVTLSMLELHDRKVFWDIGFCTGSVSIEAKLQFPHLFVYSFEKRKEGLHLIKNNSIKFGTPGIESFIGDFTEMELNGFPKPDAVFIGGYGGNLKGVIEKVASVIDSKGLLVFNSVSNESKMLFIEYAGRFGFEVTEKLRVVVDDNNPIEIIKAQKCE